MTLPALPLNVAVCGGTGEGKSYLAGLICEQLVRLGYSLVVFDPEGDHIGLGELRDVLVTGGDDRRLADPARSFVCSVRYVTVVVDLSHLDAAEQATYLADLPAEIEAHRAMTGLPQWVVVDEAHGPFGRAGRRWPCSTPPPRATCSSPGGPGTLGRGPRRPGRRDRARLTAALNQLVDLTAAVADMPRAEIARLLDGPTGRAVLAWRQRPRQAVAFTLGCPDHPAPAPRAQVRPFRRRARPLVLFPNRARHAYRGDRRQPRRTGRRLIRCDRGCRRRLPRPRLLPLGRCRLPRPTAGSRPWPPRGPTPQPQSPRRDVEQVRLALLSAAAPEPAQDSGQIAESLNLTPAQLLLPGRTDALPRCSDYYCQTATRIAARRPSF